MVTFFLLGKKGLEVLEHLNHKAWDQIEMLIIGRDTKVVEDYSEDILKIASTRGIPHRISNQVSTFDSEFAIAIGWRRLINCEDNQQLIVLHDSILPRLRGFNPLVTALINGDREIGVTALFASEKYDRGAIIDSETIRISYPIKIKDAIDKISHCYSMLVNRLMDMIVSNKALTGIEQDETHATYSLWRDHEDYYINWEDPADKIARHVDAVGFPYEGAKTHYNGQIITIMEVRPLEDVHIENRKPGKVIFKKEEYLVVVCGKGLLMIKKAADSNNQHMDFSSKFRIRFK